mmetsp:Transcript_8093/g.15909  ORF Transcript_8093/g.15909 Transcript_8093/m.15909 type:complete len:350 (-) Transcript_8093:1508-2557(-)
MSQGWFSGMFDWFSSPPPPEPEERKTTKTCQSVQSSSIASLTNRSSMRQNTLPDFLRFSPEGSRFSTANRTLPIYDRSKPETARSARHERMPSGFEQSPIYSKREMRDASPFAKTKSSTRNSSRSGTNFSDVDLYASERQRSNEVVLKLTSIELTNYDISTFNVGRDFSINVVDAYFSVLRSRSRKILLKNPDSERVLLMNYKLTSAIFDQRASEAVCSRRNVFKFDTVAFPIFRGYWNLMVVNMQERKVFFFDPLKQMQKLEDILFQLFRFLKAEMWVHERRIIDNTDWVNLQYVNASEYNKFPVLDSGVFICRQAELLLEEGECDPEMSDLYRRMVQEAVLRSSSLV